MYSGGMRRMVWFFAAQLLYLTTMPCNTTQSLSNTSLKDMNILLNAANGMPPDQAPFCWIVPLIAGPMASLPVRLCNGSGHIQSAKPHTSFPLHHIVLTCDQWRAGLRNLATQCCAKAVGLYVEDRRGHNCNHVDLEDHGLSMRIDKGFPRESLNLTGP